MEIPRKIHYIWVGGKEKPKEVKRCIKTWKKIFKNYDIIEWNEKNFDINSHPYTKSAYENKKWAFVSDYIRAYVLYNEGGIYLDTDVIAVEEFGEMLNNNSFIGFENNDYISAAIIGAQKGNKFIKDILNYYDNLEEINFNFNDNNSISVTKILKDKYGCILNNTKQNLKDTITIYPDGILSNPSKDSKTIHIFSGTWLEEKKQWKRKINEFIKYRLTNKTRISIYLKLKG